MKEYWTSIEDLEPQDSSEKKDKEGGLPELLETGKASRRDFLKFFGFSVASAAVLSSCQKPVNKAIPLLVQPEDIKAGIANYYASTFYDGAEVCGILVKVRDGRPIKIDGNDLSPLTKGGTSAKVQASLLNLYDESRPNGAFKNGQPSDWSTVLQELESKLGAAGRSGEITLVSGSVVSPSALQIIEALKKKYPSLIHIQYDAVSGYGLRKAWEKVTKANVLPSFRFDNAKVIVGFNADFLGTWLEPVRQTKQYIKGRKLSDGQKEMSQHFHFESTMTLTGSNADYRYPMKPSEEGLYVAALYQALCHLRGISGLSGVSVPSDIEQVANVLWKNKGQSLVVSGSNDENVQILVAGINELIGSFGKTIDFNEPIAVAQGDDKAFSEWIDRLETNKVKGVIFWDVNPLYNYPDQQRLKAALKKSELAVAITSQKDETSQECAYLLGANHFLESWNYFEPVASYHLLAQPTISPLFDTLQGEEILMKLAGIEGSYYDCIRSIWQKQLYTLQKEFISFNRFWDHKLHDGVFVVKTEKSSTFSVDASHCQKAGGEIVNAKREESGFEVILYQNVAVGDGHLANNPWLQELPDPVSKVCWDNYLAVSPFDANLRGWSNGDVVRFNDVSLPVLIQPGQARNTLAIALGYGRTNAGLVATGVGVNAYLFAKIEGGVRSYYSAISDVKNTGSTYELAATQLHHSMEKRPIVRETTLSEYLNNPASGNEMHAEVEKQLVTLYEKHVYHGHHWAMVIDLNSCIGCNACVVACSAENNVPVVGRNEVRRSHEMHWIRIDRYYAGDAENPEVVRQPVMCQHCDNAPCENVCPVSATSHSSEGINQMAYNRCIGTRYCNNNCAYKVRRFNWYDYTGADAIPGNTIDPTGMTLDLKRMVLNPDVTVRAKGVIEKCSLCVQRIQEKKLVAKTEGREVQDGDIQTACQQSCPADAIVFGDLNDENSRVVELMKEARRYHLLEELQTLPSVAYLTKVRNIDKTLI